PTGAGPHRQRGRQRLRRPVPRLLHRQPRSGKTRWARAVDDVPQREVQPAVRGGRAGDRGGGRQRSGGRRDDGRPRRSPGPRPAARPAPRGAGEVQPPGEVRGNVHGEDLSSPFVFARTFILISSGHHRDDTWVVILPQIRRLPQNHPWVVPHPGFAGSWQRGTPRRHLMPWKGTVRAARLKSARRTVRPVQLAVEVLEDRAVPAATPY